MSGFDFYKDSFIPSGKALVSADSRALRYGDGLFETIKVINNQVLLADAHLDRLFHGMELLDFDIPPYFTRRYITERILELCKKNNTEKTARVRLSVLRGNGGPYNAASMQPELLIQSWVLPENTLMLNPAGLRIGIYPDARKSCDIFAGLKSNNYLPYLLAAQFAQKNQLEDAVLLNVFDRICDATIANVNWIKNGTIFTPPLSEGCVAGVMRGYILENCKAKTGMEIYERNCNPDDLMQADELFLTNAITGIRWVASCGTRQYSNQLTSQLYDTLIKPMHVIE